MNNETMLSSLVHNALNSDNREEFSKKIYKDVYALVYPVMKSKKESELTTKEAIDYLINNLYKINFEKNIYRQLATMVSSFLSFKLREEIKEFNTEDIGYTFDKLKDDKEIYGVTKNNVTAFRSVKDFKDCGRKFRNLPASLMVILELYGYEMHSVYEICKLTDLNEDKVRGLLNEIRRYYGLEILMGTCLDEPLETTNATDLSEVEDIVAVKKSHYDDVPTLVKASTYMDKEAEEDFADTSMLEEITLFELSKEEQEAVKKASDAMPLDDLEVRKLAADIERKKAEPIKSLDGGKVEKESKKLGPIVAFLSRLFPDLSIRQARTVATALFALIAALVILITVLPVLDKGDVASDEMNVPTVTESQTETTTDATESTESTQKETNTKSSVEKTKKN